MRMTRRVWVRVCLERVQYHGVLMVGKFMFGKCACRALHRERVGLCRHGQDEMKGIALVGLLRDWKASLLPFLFEISHRLLAGDDLSVLIFEIELPIS